MSYFTEQLVANASPSTVVRAKIDEMIQAHPAWDFVEEFVDGTYTSRVYKNDGALNGMGKDMYVTMSHTTATPTTSSFYLQASEGFDGTGNLLIRGCANPATTFTPEATFESATGATGYAPSNANWNRVLLSALNTTDMTYWLVVTATGIWYRSTVDLYASHCGFFDQLWSHANFYPIWMGHMGNNDIDLSGSVSRRPSQAGVSLTDAFATYSYDTTTTRFSTPIGTVPDVGSLFEKAYGTRMFVYSGSLAADNGKYFGLARDVLVFNINATVNIGDTIQVGTDTYLCIYDGTTQGIFVNTEAP
jgi:hypothetical protein